MIETLLVALVGVLGGGGIAYIITRSFVGRFNGLERLSSIIDSVAGSKSGKEDIEDMILSFKHIGNAAYNLNLVLSDEVAFDGMLTTLAGKIRKSAMTALAGYESGNSKRMAEAEVMVDKAMVEGAKNLNPLVGIVLEATGLGAELEENPKMLGYILEVISNRKGLMNMLDLGSLATPTGESQGTQLSRKDFQ